MYDITWRGAPSKQACVLETINTYELSHTRRAMVRKWVRKWIRKWAAPGACSMFHVPCSMFHVP